MLYKSEIIVKIFERRNDFSEVHSQTEYNVKKKEKYIYNYTELTLIRFRQLILLNNYTNV